MYHPIKIYEAIGQADQENPGVRFPLTWSDRSESWVPDKYPRQGRPNI